MLLKHGTQKVQARWGICLFKFGVVCECGTIILQMMSSMKLEAKQ
jgi:hypothetical protein